MNISNLAGQWVQVYRNLHTGNWSVRQNGKVLGHVEELYLEQVLFYVSTAGQQKVRANKQRAVHAWATGRVLARPGPACPTLVRYNAYEADTFYDPQKRPVYTARFAHFHQPPGSEKPGCFILSSNG